MQILDFAAFCDTKCLVFYVRCVALGGFFLSLAGLIFCARCLHYVRWWN